MALTYALTHTPDNKFVFKKGRSYLTTVVSVIGGLLFAFGGLVIPVVVFKVLVFICGIGFSVAAMYLPSFNSRFVPEQTTFALSDQSVTFEMADGSLFRIPISNVKEFFIDTEKRSPSAANSAGIHYLHHHINLKRRNEAFWTITTTTDATEANRVHELLSGFIGQSNSNGDTEISFSGSDKINVESGEAHRIWWQESKYELLIERSKIHYTEYKANKEKETEREFATSEFKCVRYSYADTIKNRNWSIVIVFGDLPSENLNLFFRDLNPVECLQLESWLEQTIKKKLSV